MESKSQHRFTLGRQSSLAPDRSTSTPTTPGPFDDGDQELSVAVESGVRLMYSANEGDVDAVKDLLDSGTDVNFTDIDGRTALHIAACQGRPDVVELLLDRGAVVDPKDRWGSTV